MKKTPTTLAVVIALGFSFATPAKACEPDPCDDSGAEQSESGPRYNWNYRPTPEFHNNEGRESPPSPRYRWEYRGTPEFHNNRDQANRRPSPRYHWEYRGTPEFHNGGRYGYPGGYFYDAVEDAIIRQDCSYSWNLVEVGNLVEDLVSVHEVAEQVAGGDEQWPSLLSRLPRTKGYRGVRYYWTQEEANAVEQVVQALENLSKGCDCASADGPTHYSEGEEYVWTAKKAYDLKARVENLRTWARNL